MEPIEHKAKMKPRAEAPEGLETDGQGNVIPMEQRTPEDQAKAVGQGLEDKNVKDPENEAKTPAAMPRSQQGQGGTGKQNDPAGQQGGRH
jgi:hypothetical protein